MMRVKFNCFGVFLLVLLVNIMAACSPAASETTADAGVAPSDETSVAADLPDIGPLQVGYMPITTFAPFFVAYEKGYFSEQGLDVELQSFRAGLQMLTPLSTGQLDVGQGPTAAALFNAFHQNLDLKVVAGGAISQGHGQADMPLLVRKDLVDGGEVTGVADLAGRKIAINIRGGTAEYLVTRALEVGGLTAEDVEWVVLPMPETTTALANKAVDAVPVLYPEADQYLQDQLAVKIIEPEEVPGTFQFGGIFFGKRLLEPANREVALRFLTAYLKAEREIYQNPTLQDDQLVEIIHQYTELPQSVIKNMGLPTSSGGRIETEVINTMQNYFIQHGYTEYTEPLPLEAMIDDSYHAEALQRLDAAQP